MIEENVKINPSDEEIIRTFDEDGGHEDPTGEWDGGHEDPTGEWDGGHEDPTNTDPAV